MRIAFHGRPLFTPSLVSLFALADAWQRWKSQGPEEFIAWDGGSRMWGNASKFTAIFGWCWTCSRVSSYLCPFFLVSPSFCTVYVEWICVCVGAWEMIYIIYIIYLYRDARLYFIRMAGDMSELKSDMMPDRKMEYITEYFSNTMTRQVNCQTECLDLSRYNKLA
jgi:hypothetical protein